MLGSRLTRWMIQGVGLAACSSNQTEGARPVDTTGNSTTAGSGSTSAGTAGSGGSSGSPNDASPIDAAGGGAGGLRDAGSIIHDDASRTVAFCTGDRAALGSRMRAGASTPAAFADAYNAELALLRGPGPMLIVLRGVNDGTPRARIAAFGALDASDASAGVRFANGHAE